MKFWETDVLNLYIFAFQRRIMSCHWCNSPKYRISEQELWWKKYCSPPVSTWGFVQALVSSTIFFFIQNSKLSHKRAILFYESFPPRKISFLSDIWEYYSCHKTKDNKTCLTSYISGSVERGSDEKLVSIKHRSFSCFLIWRRRSQSPISSPYRGCNHTVQIKHFNFIRFCFPYK